MISLSKVTKLIIYLILVATISLYFYNFIGEYDETGKCSNHFLCQLLSLNDQTQSSKNEPIVSKNIEIDKGPNSRIYASCNFMPSPEPSKNKTPALGVNIELSNELYQLASIVLVDQVKNKIFSVVSLNEYAKTKFAASFSNELCDGHKGIQIELEYIKAGSSQRVKEIKNLVIEWTE